MLIARLLRQPGQWLPLVAGAVCVWLLSKRLEAVDIPAVLDAVRDLAPAQWALAGLASIASLLAVGQYDTVLHRALGTGISAARARFGGLVAIALSQTVGFGMISGALVRWRMLPELSLWQASKLTAVVAASFLAAWAVVTSAAILIFAPGFAMFEASLAWVAITLAVILALIGLKGRPLLPRRMAPPNLMILLPLLFWVTVDTALAATALWLLLPAGSGLSFAVLFPAFLVALGVGMISGSPAGLGAFELTLLMLLPADVTADALAATLAFRLVYYALPALIALLPLARGGQPAAASGAIQLRNAADGFDAGANAEAGILHDGDGLIVSDRRRSLGARLTPHAFVALGPALTGDTARAGHLLQAAARRTGRIPAFYKLPARAALALRHTGWAVTAIAEEAVITPLGFGTDGPDKRQLRRMLRKAEDAGITVRVTRGAFPWGEMQAVHRDWSARNGAERGFSMGRFNEQLLRKQRVYLIEQGERLLGFVSFHTTPQRWVLDVMRQTGDCPAGAMHAAVLNAIRDAADAGVAALSLAAVPLDARHEHRGFEGLIRRHVARHSGADGLRRFKSTFAPRWERRYLVAPSRWHAALAAAEIGRAIRSPDKGISPVPLAVRRKPDASAPQEDYENYEFASYSRACETGRR